MWQNGSKWFAFWAAFEAIQQRKEVLLILLSEIDPSIYVESRRFIPLMWVHVLPYKSGGIHFLTSDPCLDTIPMPLKHTLSLKINMLQLHAKRAFAGTSISITTDGQRHLGVAIGPREYTAGTLTSKVQV